MSKVAETVQASEVVVEGEAQVKPQPDAATVERERDSAPLCVIVIGMAGSGKTTFVQRLQSFLCSQDKPPMPVDPILSTRAKEEEGAASLPTTTPFLVNLDPAVLDVPFAADLDIRDTIDYKGIMEMHKLGPNGAILTCLNLFSVAFHNVIDAIDEAVLMSSHPPKYAVFDTPGQIELFTWSASGAIITDALASTYPTAIVYVVDTSRCVQPATFMSNMLYACSILYKTRLPFILAFNKTDDTPADFLLEWMQDEEAFQLALSSESAEASSEGGYMTSMIGSMALMLEEFYKHLKAVPVSAYTGDGFDDLLDALKAAKEEYWLDFYPELEKKVQAKKSDQEKRSQKESLARLMKDLSLGKAATDAKASQASSSRPRQVTFKSPSNFDEADPEEEEMPMSGDDYQASDEE